MPVILGTMPVRSQLARHGRRRESGGWNEAGRGPDRPGKPGIRRRRSVEQSSLRELVHGRVTELFSGVSEEECKGVYHLVIREVEGSLLEAAMQRTGGNQGRAARILGINRGTLRKKLHLHGLVPWPPRSTGSGDG